MQKLFIIALLLSSIFCGCTKKKDEKKIEGPTLPEAVFTKSDGQKIKTTELNTGIVVISVVTSWCAPCKQEILWLADAQKTGVNALALTYEDTKEIVKIAESLKINVPVAYADTSFFTALGLKAYPMRILLKDGIIMETEVGSPPPQQSKVHQKLEEFFSQKDTLRK